MAFHVGQKVVCVDADPGPGFHFSEGRPLKHGAIYTIAAVGITHWHRPGVALVEAPRLKGKMFRNQRFRPLIERKTDISIFTEMLKPKTRELVGCGND